MSGIMEFLSGSGAAPAAGGINGMSILMQAIGAAMRGESPQAFMKRLANQHPQLRKMNLDDLQGSAQQLCQQKGVDAGELAKQLDGVIDPMLKK
jgi:hypothetical protein